MSADMTQDLNALLKTLQELNRAAREPGKLSREKIEAEVKRITIAVKQALANLHKHLPPEAASASAVLVDLFRVQIGALMEHSGLDIEQSEEMKKLTEELEGLKRTFIRG
jgi:hypothetical protein